MRQVVIGGWRPRRGYAELPGSLLVGVSEENGVRYLGAVSAGLAEPEARALAPRLRRATRRTSSFGSGGPQDARWGHPVADRRVTFDGWTRRGTLRRPRWRGLRLD